jgi:cytochrome c peroxidase
MVVIGAAQSGLVMGDHVSRDVGKTKGPVLRGRSAREPYFHNGSPAALDDVVNTPCYVADRSRRYGCGFRRRSAVSSTTQ